MTVPKINRSLALRALLVVGAMFAIGGVTLAGAASSGSGPERAPRSVALVKAHQYTARPRPSTMRPASVACPASLVRPARLARPVHQARRDRKACPDVPAPRPIGPQGSTARTA